MERTLIGFAMGVAIAATVILGVTQLSEDRSPECAYFTGIVHGIPDALDETRVWGADINGKKIYVPRHSINWATRMLELKQQAC